MATHHLTKKLYKLSAAQKRKVEKAMEILRGVVAEMGEVTMASDREKIRIQERLMESVQYAGSALKD